MFAYFYVYVVFLAIVEERDGLVGLLGTVENNAGYGFAAVIVNGDVMKSFAV